MTMRHRLALSLAAVALLATLALGSCDHGSSPTAAHPELDPAVEAPEPASGSPFLLSAGKPVLPPGLRNQPVGQVMAMELVGFPHPDDVGVCFTQVASPAWMLRANPPPWLTGAPVRDRGRTPAHVFLNLWRQEEPFRLHRLEVDLPQQAWAEADGRVAFLQYRMKDQQGRVHRLARCVIPASQVAADHLLDRFSYGRADRAVVTPFSTSAASCSAGQLGVSPGPGAGRSAPSLVEDPVCEAPYCPCPEDNPFNVPGPAGASPQGTSGSPNCNCVVREDPESGEAGCFPLVDIEGLEISPGCTGWGTWWSSFSEECECIDSSLEPDGNGDCVSDMGDPGSGGGIGCDPFWENCDPGGDGGSNPPGDSNDPPDCNPAEQDCPLFGISIALADDAVLPGGITDVTVTIQPPYPGVTVYLSSSVSGLDPYCHVPIGVFGNPSGETDSEGTFTTTYMAGLDVEVETIYAEVSDAFDDWFFDEAGLSVTGTCGTRQDRIVYEYGLKNVNERPSSCQEFTQSGASANFSWPELNGRGPASNAPFGNLHFPHGEWGLVRESLRQGLEATRVNFGGRPISLTSGYRDPCGNANVDGVSQSLHMQGRAADMFPAGYRGDPAKLDTLWLAAEAAGGWGGKRYGHDRIHFQW
jgi:hypothetical protein